jgi:hypothetical protein
MCISTWVTCTANKRIVLSYNHTTLIVDSINANNCQTNTNLRNHIIAKADLSNDSLYRMNNIFDLIRSNLKPLKAPILSFTATSSAFTATNTPTTAARSCTQGREK